MERYIIDCKLKMLFVKFICRVVLNLFQTNIIKKNELLTKIIVIFWILNVY